MVCENSGAALRSRVLVAEDNPSNYKLVEVLLRRDYDLVHAVNGAEAVELFRPAVPVIALTAYAFETDRRRMFDAGFDDCLAKPLRADELRARVAAMLAAKEDI